MTREEMERRSNFYGLMCGKMSDHARFFECLQDAMSTFIYTGLPETLPVEFLEAYLICNGSIGIGKINGELYAAPGGYCGDYNGYLPEMYQAEVNNRGVIYGKAGVDVAVGWNNCTRTPDFDIKLTGDILHEIDISETIVTIFTRLLRIPKAASDAEAAAIESSIEALLRGDIKAVASSNTLQDILNELGAGKTDNRFLDLVDPQYVDQLQYLNQYRDNIIKRFMQRRGQAMQITSKLAQQTNAEMHGTDGYCMIYPLQQLHYRQKMCDDINRIFGTDISVEFNELVKNSYDVAVNYIPNELNERGVIDGQDTMSHDTTDNADSSSAGDPEPAGSDTDS